MLQYTTTISYRIRSGSGVNKIDSSYLRLSDFLITTTWRRPQTPRTPERPEKQGNLCRHQQEWKDAKGIRSRGRRWRGQMHRVLSNSWWLEEYFLCLIALFPLNPAILLYKRREDFVGWWDARFPQEWLESWHTRAVLLSSYCAPERQYHAAFPFTAAHFRLPCLLSIVSRPLVETSEQSLKIIAILLLCANSHRVIIFSKSLN